MQIEQQLATDAVILIKDMLGAWVRETGEKHRAITLGVEYY
jgi:hypothetical protein